MKSPADRFVLVGCQNDDLYFDTPELLGTVLIYNPDIHGWGYEQDIPAAMQRREAMRTMVRFISAA
ncbi:hypothetical protein JXA80_01105, partial [bacterium]|nr:hypothetical protein [candidate division CSSED10-310 bacterium]